jgi:hypothetical protein
MQEALDDEIVKAAVFCDGWFHVESRGGSCCRTVPGGGRVVPCAQLVLLVLCTCREGGGGGWWDTACGGCQEWPSPSLTLSLSLPSVSPRHVSTTAATPSHTHTHNITTATTGGSAVRSPLQQDQRCELLSPLHLAMLGGGTAMRPQQSQGPQWKSAQRFVGLWIKSLD